MRGGSRSGMACAFVRFETQQVQPCLSKFHALDFQCPCCIRDMDVTPSRVRSGDG